MQIGMIGLGRMGANMVRRLLRGGHSAVVFDFNPDAVAKLVARRRDRRLVARRFRRRSWRRRARRGSWCRPATRPSRPSRRSADRLVTAATRSSTAATPSSRTMCAARSELAPQRHRLHRRRHERRRVGPRARLLPDDRRARPTQFARLEPIFKTLAPGKGTIPDTPARRRRRTCRRSAQQGYLHCGPVGAGHFVKMVHNGIEYGLMQAYAEGFDILRGARSEKLPDRLSATISISRRSPKCGGAAAWSARGCSISRRRRSPTAPTSIASPASCRTRAKAAGRFSTAIEEDVSAPRARRSLFARFRSRQDHTFGEKLLSAMREQFGGHAEPRRSSGDSCRLGGG